MFFHRFAPVSRKGCQRFESAVLLPVFPPTAVIGQSVVAAKCSEQMAGWRSAVVGLGVHLRQRLVAPTTAHVICVAAGESRPVQAAWA